MPSERCTQPQLKRWWVECSHHLLTGATDRPHTHTRTQHASSQHATCAIHAQLVYHLHSVSDFTPPNSQHSLSQWRVFLCLCRLGDLDLDLRDLRGLRDLDLNTTTTTTTHVQFTQDDYHCFAWFSKFQPVNCTDILWYTRPMTNTKKTPSCWRWNGIFLFGARSGMGVWPNADKG